MTVRKVRSENSGLLEGATDGKYRKRRPNTTVEPDMGDQKVVQNRSGLHPYMNYGFINSEEPAKVNPLGQGKRIMEPTTGQFTHTVKAKDGSWSGSVTPMGAKTAAHAQGIIE